MKSKSARGGRRVRLAPGRRVRAGSSHKGHILTSPTGPVQLNETAAAILSLCDGTRTREEIIADALASRDASLAEDVKAFLAAARRRGWILEE